MVQIAALLWVALDEKEEGNEIASAWQLSEKGNKKQTDVQQQKTWNEYQSNHRRLSDQSSLLILSYSVKDIINLKLHPVQHEMIHPEEIFLIFLSSRNQSYSEHWWWLSFLKKSWASSVRKGKHTRIVSFPPLDVFFNESCCVLLVCLNDLNSCCAESLQSERDTTVNPEKQAGLRHQQWSRSPPCSLCPRWETHCTVCVFWPKKMGGTKKPPERIP